MPSLAPHDSALFDEFRRTLADSRELYCRGADDAIRDCPEGLGPSAQAFRDELEALRQATLVKVFSEMAHADAQWSENERALASELADHLWGESVKASRRPRAFEQAARQAAESDWSALVEPFGRIAPLRERADMLQTVVMRLANVVAKIDGTATPETMAQLKAVQYQLWQHMHQRVPDAAHEERATLASPRDCLAESKAGEGLAWGLSSHDDAGDHRQDDCERTTPVTKIPAEPPDDGQTPEQRLAAALAKLNALVGLAGVKAEVHGLVNYLRMQQQRREHGLPETGVTLHLVFTGNPGTGKTSVARLVGRIFSAMGLLERGHLVETDRSGLVAEYAGQTGPKTNRKVDEALDGVLFVDEAYGLVADDGEDSFGNEAVQALLKRVEDDRARLVVILAGYSQPIERLLESNPGLDSRFPRRIDFPDYSAIDLCEILGRMCAQQHYTLPAATRWKLLCGFSALVAERDEHFGNGRTARNVFENALRRMANRIATAQPLTAAMLSAIEPADVEFPGLAEASLYCPTVDGQQASAACPQCHTVVAWPAERLGGQATCSACCATTLLEWGEPVSFATSSP